MTTVSTGTPGPTAIGADDRELAPGTEVGDYRIEAVIGKGGFGTVYGAVHPLIGKRVAIKVLARRYAADPDIVSRFVAEARAVNQIRHRNIIDIFLFSQLPDGRHYYVMEHLDGEPLDSYLRTHGRMPLDEALPILRAIARALDAAHGKGIAHRDLKPENIFLAHDTDGVTYPKLLDFGIAKLMTPEDDVVHRTGTGVPIGTPYYMSPEQCRGRDVDHRTDIYSFGIVAYRMLTGAFPFEGADYMELLFKQTSDEPPPPTSIQPDLPPSVDDAIAWMMRKDREQRPPSVIDAVNALDPSAPAPSISGRSRPLPGRTTGRGSTKNALALAETGISSPNALAETRPADPARPSGRRGLVLALLGLFVAGAGAGVWFAINSEKPRVAVSEGSALPTPVVTPLAPVAPVAVDAPPAPPKYITLELHADPTGELPPGTFVTLAGRRMGTAPKLSLDYGTTELSLTIEAPGHLPAALTITPNSDQVHEVKLVKKRVQRKKDRDDIEQFPAGRAKE